MREDAVGDLEDGLGDPVAVDLRHGQRHLRVVEDVDRDWITETVFDVADGILAQGFEPPPSYAACSICDYRIACPAAER